MLSVFCLAPLFPKAVYPEEKTKETAGSGGVIVDLTAPPGLKTEQQKREWKQWQEQQWAKVSEQHRHVRQANVYFRVGRYQDALQEYQRALAKAGTKATVLQAEEGIAWAYEGLGEFGSAAEKAAYLATETVDPVVKQDTSQWRQALEAAAQGHYDIVVQYYKDRFATAKDWEKKSLFLEQRLRLMEERARSAGQLQPEGN